MFFDVSITFLQVDIPRVLKMILEFIWPGVHGNLFLLPNYLPSYQATYRRAVMDRNYRDRYPKLSYEDDK